MIIFIILALKENQAWERFFLPRGFSLHATGKKKLRFLLIIPFISMYNQTWNTFTKDDLFPKILQPIRFWDFPKPISLLRLFSWTKFFYTKTLKRRAQVSIDTRKSHSQNVTLCLQNPTLWLIFQNENHCHCAVLWRMQVQDRHPSKAQIITQWETTNIGPAFRDPFSFQ